MKRLEFGILAIGALLIVVGVAAYDWRLGLTLFGLFLIASVIDLPRRRA